MHTIFMQFTNHHHDIFSYTVLSFTLFIIQDFSIKKKNFYTFTIHKIALKQIPLHPRIIEHLHISKFT